MAAMAWTALLEQAAAIMAVGKFSDSFQYINRCMEEFEREIISGTNRKGGKLLQKPKEFLRTWMPMLTKEQQAALARMHEVRGDILVGLGANKRALTMYNCSQVLAGDAVADKIAKTEASLTARKRKQFDKVPCTVLTGFLGSGKTTLLNHILRAHHGKRLAVIENEFGEVGIDDELVERSLETREHMIEMSNGCICCTVRGDLIAALKKLVKKAVVEKKPLDGIIIETTGLADPAPVAQTFFADNYVQSKLYLDGILSVVDAKHILQHLNEEKPEGVENEAVEQIAFADRILLNKCDLVDEATLKEVEQRIRAINNTVPLRRTINSSVSMEFLIGIDAFSLDKVLDMDMNFLDPDGEHSHDDRVSSIGIDVPGEVDEKKLNAWIGSLMEKWGMNLFRYKGILAVQDMAEKLVFQGIHTMFASSPQQNWAKDEAKRCKMTFIGKDLNKDELRSGFLACMIERSAAAWAFRHRRVQRAVRRRTGTRVPHVSGLVLGSILIVLTGGIHPLVISTD